MCLHESKTCPRCNDAFECKPGNISQCHCFEIVLTLEERVYIDQKFADCLCNHCICELKKEYTLFLNKFVFDKPLLFINYL